MVAKKQKNKNTQDTKMTFIEHLEELRIHIIRTILVFIVFSILTFLFKDFIFNNIILWPKNQDFITNNFLCYLSEKFNSPVLCINTRPLTIINISLAGQFRAHILISFIVALIITFPYLIYEIWMFVKPALKSTEKKKLRNIVFSTTLLFFIGVVFGYFIIVPLTINFLGNYVVSEEIINKISLDSYISFVGFLSLSTGLIFELPLIILFLTKISLLSYRTLKKYRKHAIVLIIIAAAIITPPDVFSQILVAVPLYLLYEISILLSKRITKKMIRNEKQN